MAIPPIAPIAHFSGSGCGNVGSYRNFGTWTFCCDCPKTTPLLSVHLAPSAKPIAAAARTCLRFMIHPPCQARVVTSGRTGLCITVCLPEDKLQEAVDPYGRPRDVVVCVASG